MECFLETIRNRADFGPMQETTWNPGRKEETVRISTLATQIHPKSWFKTLRGFCWISRWHFTISWRQAAHRPVACPGPQRETPPPSRRQSGSGPPNPAAYCATSARSGLAVLHQSAANSGNWFDSTRGEQAELRYGWMEPCVVQFSLSMPCAMEPNRGIYKMNCRRAHSARCRFDARS